MIPRFLAPQLQHLVPTQFQSPLNGFCHNGRITEMLTTELSTMGNFGMNLDLDLIGRANWAYSGQNSSHDNLF